MRSAIASSLPVVQMATEEQTHCSHLYFIASANEPSSLQGVATDPTPKDHRSHYSLSSMCYSDRCLDLDLETDWIRKLLMWDRLEKSNGFNCKASPERRLQINCSTNLLNQDSKNQINHQISLNPRTRAVFCRARPLQAKSRTRFADSKLKLRTHRRPLNEQKRA